MAVGRCAGCGKESPSGKVMAAHLRVCPPYAKLFLENPDAALDPEAEYRRHREWLASEEAQQQRDDRDQDRAQEFRTNAERILQRERERWGSKSVPLLTEERDSV